MYCMQCGAEVKDGNNFCPNCGAPLNGQNGHRTTQENVYWNDGSGKIPSSGYHNNAGHGSGNWNNSNVSRPGYQNNTPGPNQRSLPAFIIGLIGSILGMMGGLCTSMCDFRTGGNAPFILIFGGAVVGLIGSCMCLNKAKTGSILQLVGALMMIICAYGITGAEFMSIFGFVLLLTGGIIGLIQSYFVKPR